MKTRNNSLEPGLLVLKSFGRNFQFKYLSVIMINLHSLWFFEFSKLLNVKH